ncbi:MAG: LysR family transcriptional regulator [Paracoccus denitrificans]|uniref:LysR family transcriptional regulator n=1 Tax=Paracoccus denitrificans TaxID=266 RepID=A0A533I9J6_PARDE|nr:MAG: LysR family transcriptional regulator [Paracoccus denitrificans]
MTTCVNCINLVHLMVGSLNLRQVDVFRAVMKFETVTAAAAALGSSQPTVTREILRLESTVGFTLFERRRQRLHPTARALKLYHAIEQAYAGLDHINTSLHRMRAADGEILQISTLPTFAQSLLPQAVCRLQREAPGVAVEIDSGDPRNQSPISGFNFDLGLIEGEYNDPTTEVIHIGTFQQVCLIPLGHPLAAQHGPLTLQDFDGHAFVSLGPNDPYRIVIDRMFQDAGVSRRIPVIIQSANAACEMVVQGLGVTIVNPLTAMSHAGERAILRPLMTDAKFVVSALHPVDRPWVDSAGKLVGHLRAVCEDASTRLSEMQLRSS